MKLIASSFFVFSCVAACSAGTYYPNDAGVPSDSSAPDSTDSGTYSCDTNVSGSHECTDYEWSGGAYSTSSFASACSSSQGAVGSGCLHTGAVGGCELKRSSGSISVTTTTWFYSGTAQTLEMACGTENGTWVDP